MSFFKYIENVLENVDQTAAKTLQRDYKRDEPKDDTKKKTEKKEIKSPSLSSAEIVKTKNEELQKKLDEYVQKEQAKNKKKKQTKENKKTNSKKQQDDPIRETKLVAENVQVDPSTSQQPSKNTLETQKETEKISTVPSKNEEIKDPSTTHDEEVVNEEVDEEKEKLKIENKFLRSTISSIHEEIADTSKRYDETSNKLKKAQLELKEKDKYIKELQERLESQMSRLLQEKIEIEQEFSKTLALREKQQKDVQEQLEEVIKQLKSKDVLISNIQNEKDSILKEKEEKEKKTNLEIEKLKQKIEELQNSLINQKKELEMKLSESEIKFNSLLDEKDNIERQYHELQEALQQKNEEFIRFENQCNLREEEFKSKINELEAYKIRALKVLQSKDKLIQQLQSNPNQTQPIPQMESFDNDMVKEHESNLLELERLKSENNELNVQLELIKRQHEAEKTSSRIKIRNLESTIEQYKSNTAKLQQTLVTMRITNDELKQRIENLEQLSRESKKLENVAQQSPKKIISPTQQELERRLRTMAENLIEKQSHIETLKSEKAALALQLEKEIQKNKEARLLNRLTSPPSKHESIIDIDTHVSMRTNTFFTDLSKRGTVARTMARLMSAVDRLSIYTGRYLRRLPFLRVLVVLYIILLHIWVFYILTHLTPSSEYTDISQ